MINLSADVVVVAAGLSGLAAAVAAAEEGKSVIPKKQDRTKLKRRVARIMLFLR